MAKLSKILPLTGLNYKLIPNQIELIKKTVNKKNMKKTDKLYKKYNAVKDDTIAAIKKAVGNKKIKFGVNSFEDDSNNYIQAINNKKVFFNYDEDDNGGDTYPLNELGLLDAIYILTLFE